MDTCNLPEDTLLTDGSLVALKTMRAAVIANNELLTRRCIVDIACRRRRYIAIVLCLGLGRRIYRPFPIEPELSETRLHDDL
jgi:hypothetical protein